MGSKSNGQQQSQQTSQQSLDPQIKASLLGNYGNVQSLVANTPSQYSGQLVAPMNATQTAGNQGLLNIANAGVGNATLQSGINAAQGASTYNPQQVAAGQLASTDLSPYLNPYTQDVTNTTLADLTRQNQMANVSNDAAATSAGAFGGDRSAVLDAQTNEGYGRVGAQTLAGLNQANYSNAQNSALTDIQNRLSAAQGNQQAGLAGQALNLNAGNSLAAMSGQQLNQQTALANLMREVGQQQQTQGQNVDTANQQQFQTNLGNTVTMQQLINQALGLAGNPTLGTSQGTSSGSSSSTSLSPSLLGFL